MINVIMDYKKKYKEALERVEQMVADAQVHQEVIEQYFPELKESEDERIRKWLIDTIKAVPNDSIEWNIIDKLDVLAWLEKQGEKIIPKNVDEAALQYVDTCPVNGEITHDNITEPYWNNHSMINAYKAGWLDNQGDKDKLIKELGEYKVKYTQEVLEKHLRTMNKDDKRLRKTTIAFLKDFAEQGYENAVECIDWLEKQGEQSQDKTALEALRGIEPKFKAGDWIISDEIHEDYRICKITNVENGNYTIESIYGYKGYNTFETFEKSYHLWTIQDAKDGDVLIDKSSNRECLFIFKETKQSDIKTDMLNPLTVLGYCGIGGAGFTKGSGWGDTANCIYYPATKKQRDLLFNKMKEAGYEWNMKNKQLIIKYGTY